MAQLKSTNVTGNLSVTGNILASKIIKIGGTSNQILMANGETTNLSDILGKLNAAVILKGTLGTLADGGTIQTLPTASATVLGHAYKVITAGTYGGITAKVGDMFICYESGTKTYAWMLIPSGDDIEDTWRPIKLEGTQILTNGTSSKPLNFKQGANITIAHSGGDLTITAQDTTYGADRGISLSNGNFGHSNTAITAQATKGLYKISYDAYGHITGTESYTDQNTTYSFASGTNCFTVTPSGGSAQTVGVTSDRLFRLDTRSANPNPYATDNYPGYITVHLKYNNIIGITGEDTYSALMQIYPWGDVSGGAAHQLVYGSKGGIYHRYGTSTWSSWNQLATREWVESLGYIDDISDYVTGPGSATDNAIALYDGTTGKKIKNSGATIDANRNLRFNGPGNISWEDGSYYQRIQVTDDSNTETAVFTFQQTENSGTAWNDLFTIQDRGTIIAKNSTGGALSLTLDRGSNANWRWLSDNGNFIAQCDYTTAKGSYFNVLTMNYNTGHISVDRGSLTSKGGFIHGNLTVPSGKTKDDYVLLAGGGSKALSDMTYSLPLATSTVRGGLKVGYTSTQDNLALTLSTATASAEQAYVSLPARLYAGNTTATTNPTHSGYYFYKDESDAGKVFNDTAGSRQAATWVSAYDGSWAAQIGVGYYKDVIAYRRKQGSTTWGSWIELADKQWIKDQGYLTAIPSRLGPNTNGNNVAPNNNHTSGWAYCSGTPGVNGLPANVSDAEYLTLGYNNSTWAHQLLFKFNGGGTTGTAYDGKDLYTRIYNQNTNSWSDWYTILTSGNVTSILNDKYVTIDTAQDITGAKTYKAPIKTTAECLGNESSNLQFVVGIKAFASGGDMLWQNASDLVWNNIPKKNLTGATHSGWTSQETDAKLIPTMNMIAYWNGAYNSSNNSNLKYSTNGEIVGGSSLTADKIVVGNGGAKIKTSSKGIVTSITATDDSNLPTSKAVADYVSEQIKGGGSGSNSEYAKFLKPQDSATSDGASTWTGSAVAGTWKRGWSQRFKHTGIGSDTGDINFWLRPAAYASGGTEVCIMIDGDFYGHTGSKRVAYTDELPSVSDKKVSITTDGKGLSGAGSFTLNQNSDTTIKLTLESSASGNRAAERVVIASAKGQIDSEKYAITNDSGTAKATWQYNSSTDCVELVWA